MKTNYLIILVVSLCLQTAFAQYGCVSGNCTNGKGTYTFENGNKYEGDFVDGKYNGSGVFTFSSGDKYVGEFKNNKREGHGVFTYANGNVYDGQNAADKFHGNGVFTFSTGDKYVGEFKDNKRNGRGVFYYANGNRHVGYYVDDFADGIGEMKYADGSRYNGEFHNGKRDGLGVFGFANGNRYSGYFYKDNFSGQGEFTYANGDRYVGDFLNGKRNGEGIFYDAEGTIQVCRWKDDKCVETIPLGSFEVSETLESCEAMMKLLKSFPSHFDDIKGQITEDWLADFYYSKIVVPPACYGKIYDDELGVGAEFSLFKGTSKEEADKLYEKFKKDIPTCLAQGWNSWENDKMAGDVKTGKVFVYTKRANPDDRPIEKYLDIILEMSETVFGDVKFYYVQLFYEGD